MQVYDPQNDTWTFGASMPSARDSLAVAVVDDRLYAIGGKPYGSPYPELVGDRDLYTHNEVYTPFGYGTPDPAYVYEHTPPKLIVCAFAEWDIFITHTVTLSFFSG